MASAVLARHRCSIFVGVETPDKLCYLNTYVIIIFCRFIQKMRLCSSRIPEVSPQGWLVIRMVRAREGKDLSQEVPNQNFQVLPNRDGRAKF